MPATEIKSCTTPASGFALLEAGPLAAAVYPFVTCNLSPLPSVSTQDAVCLLKNSDDDSRLTGTCFVRAMIGVL